MFSSIMQGVMKKKSNLTLNELILKAKRGNQEVMDDLLIEFTPFMKKTASFICKRYIDEHDDEFSIALSGFHEAVITFNPEENASLTTYAYLIIKRRLVDYFRKEETRGVICFSKDEDDPTGPNRHHVFDQSSIMTYSREQQATERREEIIEYSKVLKDYGLSFTELTKASPKHKDSRKTAIQIAQIIAETPEYFTYLTQTKKLPMKELVSTLEVSRKTIERHRKYIIAVTLLLNSRFEYIKEYIKGELI